MNNFSIPISLAQAIADYLQQRPYREVAVLLQEMAKLQPIPEPHDKKETE